MSYSEIINTVSEELDLPKDLVDKTYKAYWSSIKLMIQALPLKEDINEEDFSKLRTSFNIPSLGKMTVSWERYQGCKKKLEYIKMIKNDKAEKY